MVSMVTWTCVQAGRKRYHPMGDGTDPVSAASGPDSDLRGKKKRESWQNLLKLFKPLCLNRKLIRDTDYQGVINTRRHQLQI